MKLYSPSPLTLRRRTLPSLFSSSFSTEINSLPPPPPPPLSLAAPRFLFPRFIHSQSVLDQIKLLSKTPKNHSSLTTLDSLLSKTHLLDSATSLVLIDYLSQINKLGRAKTVISHLKSTGRVSDPFLYSLVFEFLVKDGTVKDAENVWTEICGTEKSFNFSNYVIFVCKFGGIDEIKDVYVRILMGVGNVMDTQSYIALCTALCNVNEGILAKNVVKIMYDKGMVVNNWTYYIIFKCFCREGNFSEADLVLRKLVKNGFTIDISIYGTFLHGLCKSGKFREANKLFKKLITRVPAKGFNEKNTVLKEGRRVIFQLNCGGVVPEMMAYESYFRALCNVGKLDEAEILLKKMLKCTILPEICVYGSFITALFRGGRDEDAMKFFKIQRKKGLIRVDEIGRFVIMGLCEKGKTDDGLRLFEEIKSVGGFVNGSDVCNLILSSYFKQKKVADVEVFVEKWRLNEGKFGRFNVTMYTIMLNGYCDDNNALKAVMVFEEMLKKKMVVNGVLFERIVRLLCDCGRENEAFEYFNDMIENGQIIFCKRWRTLFKTILSIDK